MHAEDTVAWSDQPSAPLEQLHQQSLKSRDYALVALALVREDQATPLREELAGLMQAMRAAFEAGEAVAHYRLDRQLFFDFMMQLGFTLQVNGVGPMP